MKNNMKTKIIIRNIDSYLQWELINVRNYEFDIS